MKDDIWPSVENQFWSWKIQYQSTEFRKWSPWRFLYILNLTKNDILVFLFNFKLQIWLLSSLIQSPIHINTMFKQCDTHLLTTTQLHWLLELPTHSLKTALFSFYLSIPFSLQDIFTLPLRLNFGSNNTDDWILEAQKIKF